MLDEMRSESSTRESGNSEARCIPRGDEQVDSARIRRHTVVANSPGLRIIIQVFYGSGRVLGFARDKALQLSRV